MRRRLVAGNWKMNGTRKVIVELIDGIKEGIHRAENVDVVVCPPNVYLAEVAHMLKGSTVSLGAQDVSEHSHGAYTGDISTEMLVDVACKSVIIGHSERRAYHQETDDLIAKKFIVAQKSGLLPIVCIGETLAEREHDETEQVIGRQLDALCNIYGGLDALHKSVIAYEPVWAIGTGKTATPEQAQEVHAFIRQRLRQHDSALADSIRILYGGSVKPVNAAELFAMPDIDGGLIGGASLAAKDFLAICVAAA